MKHLLFAIALIAASYAWAQDEDGNEGTTTISEGTEVVAASCSLSIKTTVLPSDSFDGTGKVRIVALLLSKTGTPIPDVEIHVSANCGTFSCKPPANEIDTDNEPDQAGFCYNTKKDGSIRVYLVNIPFNKPGKVLATCQVGTFFPRAISTFVIRRAIIKGKITKKSAKN
jgi:hypothetical protein